MSVPETPYTRGEMYLSAIADGDSSGIPERPYTRKEMYLDAIARGDSSGIPERPYTREEMYLDAIAKNGGGGGGDITVESKSISANGTYTAPTGKAYSPVTVSVPASAVDSGTKSITSNGNNQDVVGYAAVDVAVPNSYAAGDEGKVVSNGELVAQSSDSVAQNGTVDTTLINSLLVNVPRAVTGTFTPTSDLRSVTLTDCIGCTNIVVYPASSIVAPASGRTHWGCMIVGGSCRVQGSTNNGNTAWSLINGGTDTFSGTSGVLSIGSGYSAGANYGGYWTSGMTYGYAAW